MRLFSLSIVIITLCLLNLFSITSADNQNGIMPPTLQSNQITTIAGTVPFTGEGNLATTATLNNPSGIVIDQRGNTLFIDAANNRVRRVDAQTGIITTVAGNGTGGFGGDGGPATAANLDLLPLNCCASFYRGLALDAHGNIFIPDVGNNRVRRVDAVTGIITTVAGNGKRGDEGDGGPATAAQLIVPTDVAVDANGNLFIGDFSNRVRRVDAVTGIISTYAGGGNLYYGDGDGGPATNVALSGVSNIDLDAAGNLFISDANANADLPSNNRIRRVDHNTNIITTVAKIGYFFKVTPQGSLIISFFSSIYLATPNSEEMVKIAGNGSFDFSGDGGPAIDAGFSQSNGQVFGGLAFDNQGNIILADTFNQRLRRIDTATGLISTIAGNGNNNFDFSGDGQPATSAKFRVPLKTALDSHGNLYIADLFNNRIRVVDAATGIISTFAGGGAKSEDRPDNIPATQLYLNGAFAITVDAQDNLYIADTFNGTIYRIDAVTRMATRIAGGKVCCDFSENIPAQDAYIGNPFDLVLDQNGNLVFTSLSRIFKIEQQTGLLRRIAGADVVEVPSGDGGPALLAGIKANHIAIDRSGNIYLSERKHHSVRRIDIASGIITRYAGNGEFGFSGDGGPATSAQLGVQEGLAFDKFNNLYIADTNNNRIRRVAAVTGIITTFAGQGGRGFTDNVIKEQAGFNYPSWLTFDKSDNLFVSDVNNDIVRMIKNGDNPLTITNAKFTGTKLIIKGAGFDLTDISILINDQDRTTAIIKKQAGTIRLTGSLSDLNLQKGTNQIVIRSESLVSNTFLLNVK